MTYLVFVQIVVQYFASIIIIIYCSAKLQLSKQTKHIKLRKIAAGSSARLLLLLHFFPIKMKKKNAVPS